MLVFVLWILSLNWPKPITERKTSERAHSHRKQKWNKNNIQRNAIDKQKKNSRSIGDNKNVLVKFVAKKKKIKSESK